MKAIRLKKITYALCLALMASVLISNRCVAQFSIPDPNFKAYLQETIPKAFDASGNLITTSKKVTSLDTLDVSKKNIKSLEGIQFFTGLKELDCSANQLTSLDISKNITLTYLSCRNNQLTNLDVSKNIDLNGLRCAENQIKNLDVSKNIALKLLVCFHNQISNLDISKNTMLIILDCRENQIKKLDVSKNIALIHLLLDNNQLTSLDVSKNIALIGLGCANNQLTNLDVSKNTALTGLGCSTNQLTSLDVSKNIALVGLECFKNQLTSLDVSKNIALFALICADNQITNLDMRGMRGDVIVVFDSGQSPLNISNNPLKKLLINSTMKDDELIKKVRTERGDALTISTYSAEEGSSNYTLECTDYNPNTSICK